MTPPLLKGGQGRTSRSVRDDADAIRLTILAVLLLIVALVAKGCSR